MYCFCEDDTPLRVLVMGRTGCGKTAFIEAVRRDWKKVLDSEDSEENENPVPEFVELNGFEFNLDSAKDEVGGDVPLCVCFCRDISAPFAESEERAVKGIVARLKEWKKANENKMLEARIVLTKSDSFGGDLKAAENGVGEKFGVPAFAMSSLDGGSRLRSFISTLGISFSIQRLKDTALYTSSVLKNMNDISDRFKEE